MDALPTYNGMVEMSEEELTSLLDENEQLRSRALVPHESLFPYHKTQIREEIELQAPQRISRAAWIAFVCMCMLTVEDTDMDFSSAMDIGHVDFKKSLLPTEETCYLQSRMREVFGPAGVVVELLELPSMAMSGQGEHPGHNPYTHYPIRGLSLVLDIRPLPAGTLSLTSGENVSASWKFMNPRDCLLSGMELSIRKSGTLRDPSWSKHKMRGNPPSSGQYSQYLIGGASGGVAQYFVAGAPPF